MSDFDETGIYSVLDAVDQVRKALHDHEYNRNVFQKKHNRPVEKLLEGILEATLFVENSTRTNFSSRVAAMRTGAMVDGFSSIENTSLTKGETWADTAAMFACYGFDVLVMRSTTEGLPRWTKEFVSNTNQQLKEQYSKAGIPFNYRNPMIINGGDGRHQHPTQCFLDLRTMLDIGNIQNIPLRGLPIALLNDIANSRVHSSIISVAPTLGLELHFAAPGRFGPRESQLEYLKAKGATFYNHGDDWEKAMRSSTIAIHSRPQKERVGKGEDLRTIKEWGCMTAERFQKLANQVPYLLHPRPVDSALFEEIHYSLRFHDADWSLFQASNGPYTRMALPAIGLDRMSIDYDFSTKKNTSLELSYLQLNVNNNSHAKAGLRSGHIEGDGIVIDHITAGRGRRLAGVLGFERENVPKTIADYLPVRDSTKDLIKLHCAYELSSEQEEAISLISPNSTINIIKSGRVVQKYRPIIGGRIVNRIDCSNDYCVTNIKEEHVTPQQKVIANGENTILECHYCGTTDTTSKIFQEERFRYIGKD